MGYPLIQLFKEYHVDPKHDNKILWIDYWGILETPCYPCVYYFGPIFQGDDGWTNRTNPTCYFHRTIDECLDAAVKFGFNDFNKETLSPMNSTY